MRWKTNKGRKDGEKRTVQYFAFFPTHLDDGYTVWLERYWVTEQWEVYSDPRLNNWRILKTSTHHPDRPTTGSTTR
jgi:hypothetical protein